MPENVLSKVMSKLLRHGFPEIKHVHNQIIKFICVDGFIPASIILNILNENNNIGLPVKKKLKTDMLDISMIKKVVNDDERSRYSMVERNNILYIRANYGHSISKVKIEKLSNMKITKDFLEKNECKIFDYFCKTDINSLMNKGLIGNNKKNLWFQLENKDNSTDITVNNRTKVYLKAAEAIDEGYSFYLNDNNFVISCGKDNMIPPNLFSIST